jgi:signal transduction histidine kinase
VPSHCHPITLRPIVSQVVKHFQDVLSSSSFQVALAPDLPFAVGNESKLEMALVNLVENALVVCHPEYPIYITADADEAYVYMAVEGMGLEEEKRSQFQPLSPTAGPDTNDDLHFSWWATPQVKLYVASKLIEAQGGHVWTENRSGKRTRFNLSLPRIEAHDVAEAFVD